MELLVGAVTQLLAFAGAIAIVYITQRHQRRDRLAERAHSLVEVHRQELRTAWATFFTVYQRYLNQANVSGATASALREIQADLLKDAQEAFSDDPLRAESEAQRRTPSGLLTEYRSGFDNLVAAGFEVPIAAATLLLLEDDEALCQRVRLLAQDRLEAVLQANEPGKVAELIDQRQAMVDDLRRILDSSFAATLWPERTRIMRQRLLDAPSAPTSPSGSRSDRL